MSPNEKDRYDAETKEMIEKATAEIPYSFTVPQSYSEFSEIVRGNDFEMFTIGILRDKTINDRLMLLFTTHNYYKQNFSFQ